MNILLINTSPVVSRLISLCVRENDTVLEEVTDVSDVKLDRYDIIFVDDASYVPEVQSILQNLMVKKKVFLSGKGSDTEMVEDFSEVIQKPFLPSQITSVIEGLKEVDDSVDEVKEEHFIFPLSTEEESLEEMYDREPEEETVFEAAETAKVLDSNEIERIKALLDENDNENEEVLELDPDLDYEARKIEVIKEQLEADGLEIVSEEEIIDTFSKKAKKKKEKAKKENKKKTKKNKDESYTFEEALIAAVEGMKVKKIKKLLKGADISIKIQFKDNK